MLTPRSKNRNKVNPLLRKSNRLPFLFGGYPTNRILGGGNGFALWLIFLFFLILTFWVCFSFAYAEEINLHIIATIESSNNPLVRNIRTSATGIYQITPICLKDYNDYHKWDYQYTLEDMFDEYSCWVVANWYLNERIPAMLKYFGFPDTIENRLICYNAGITFVIEQKNYPERQDTISKNI